MVYIYNGLWLGHTKNEILPSATTRMDLEGTVLSEVSETEKDRCHIILFICGIFKQNKTK